MSAKQPSLSQRGKWSAFVLLEREARVMLANPQSLALLIIQPLLISLLISLAGSEAASIPKKLFLGSVAVLWLACSNAAQVIVRERPIFRRERLAGLRLGSYLCAKYFFMGTVATAQALVLYGGLRLFGNGIIGFAPIQIAAFAGSVWMMTAVGILISSSCKDSTQAAFAVPIIIIPQILFAGYVFPLEEWKPNPSQVGGLSHKTAAAVFGLACPSRATQQLIDVSLFWGRKHDASSMEKEGLDSTYRDPPHWKNVCLSVVPLSTWLGAGPNSISLSSEDLEARFPPDPTKKAPRRKLPALNTNWPNTPELPLGRVYQDWNALTYPLSLMAIWIILSLGISVWVLRNG